MVNQKNKIKPVTLVLAVLFVFFSAWWIATFVSSDFRDRSTVLLSEIYGIVALLGGVYGIAIANKWGYFKSYFGKTILFLSFGLLLQVFGQVAYTYLNTFRHVEVPYPSYPDIGFFGSIPMYILASYFLMKGLGILAIIKKKPLKLVVGIIVPILVLATSYWFFLKGYDTTDKSAAVIFFDFAYPLAQAIYVSVALVILLSIKGLLGGLMRKPVLLLLIAFVAQYASDFNFLYQTVHETWGPGGYGDYLYFIAYCIMGISLITLTGVLSGAASSRPAIQDKGDA